MLCHTSKTKFDPKDLCSLFATKLDMLLVDFLKKFTMWGVLVQNYGGVPFVAKLQASSRQQPLRSRFYLLFDGTEMPRDKVNAFDKRRGVWYLLLDNSGALLSKSKHLHSQRSHNIPKELVSQPLEILLSDRLPDCFTKNLLPAAPTNLEEVKAWLKHVGLSDKIYISYCVSLFRKVAEHGWLEGDKYDRDKKILAFKDENNRLSFSSSKETNLKRDLAWDKKELRRASKQSAIQPDRMGVSPPNAFDHNRSSSVSVALHGLTLGIKLGFLTLEEAGSLTSKLSLGVLAFWFHFDTLDKVCHVFLQDGLGFKKDFEILALKNDNLDGGDYEQHTDEEYNSWKAVFDCIWERRSVLLDYKQKLLEPLFKQTEEKERGTVARYYSDLKAFANRFKVITFGKSDKCLHALKVYLTHFVFEKQGKGCRGVTLKTVNQMDVVCLQSKEADFENIAGLFKEDQHSPSKWIDQGLQLLSVFREWKGGDQSESLPPSPVIEGGLSLRKQGFPYTPCQTQSLKREGCKTRLGQRGDVLTGILLKLYTEFTVYLMQSFSMDIVTVRFISLPTLSFKCLWLNYAEKAGPLGHSLEKTKVFYENQLRVFCKGGFSYSFQDRLASGEPLWPEGSTTAGSHQATTAEAVVEYDLKTSYGYSGSQMKAPKGFCVGFTNNNNSSNRSAAAEPANTALFRSDKMQRVNSFEFMGVMNFVHSLMAFPEDIEIVSVFSNFSALGIFWIGKYPVDLAVVATKPAAAEGGGPPKKMTYIVQFDGRFVHGCRGLQEGVDICTYNAGRGDRICCPPLDRYCDHKTEAELIAKTRLRDQATKEWIEQKNRASWITGMQYRYIVLSDCHDLDFTTSRLLELFHTVPELSRMREPYATLFRYSIGIDDILRAHPGLTYVLVGSGHCPTLPPDTDSHMQDRPMLVWKQHPETGSTYQDFDWNPEGEALYTRDTLEFAVRQFGFKLDVVTCVYFYAVDLALPEVFADLVETRRTCDVAQLHSKSKFIKSLINYSSGMFGFNPRKQTFKPAPARIVKSAPRNAHIGDYKYHFMGELGDNGYFVAQKMPAVPSQSVSRQKVLNAALPLYACIAEYGKMRLNACLRFILRVAQPDSVRVAYSQVDNLVLVLAKPTLEETVAPAQASYFQREMHNFFTTASEPGKLKLEWRVSAEQEGPWKFVSPRPCSYAVTLNSADREQSKMSCLNNLSSRQTYEACSRLLDRQPVTFVQERRVNRLLSTATRQVEITFAPK